MMKVVMLALVALAAGSAARAGEDRPLSDAFIERINQAATTWTAGRNFHRDTPRSHLRRLAGVLPGSDAFLPPVRSRSLTPDQKAALPLEFDARSEWPDCPSLEEIRDQGACGSCWAIAAASVMTDRACIASGSAGVRYSTEDVLSCCHTCGFGCGGGYPAMAMKFWKSNGVVTGGAYDSSEGCKSYSIPPCQHHVDGPRPDCSTMDFPTPKCEETCDAGFEGLYASDKNFATESYSLPNDEEQIMADIMENGSVEAAFDVYEDFYAYQSGVYQHTTGPYLGGHAIKIMGWGVEDGVKYWLCANSWNSDWGDKGYFKFLRGENHCGMEGSIVAGIPA